MKTLSFLSIQWGVLSPEPQAAIDHPPRKSAYKGRELANSWRKSDQEWRRDTNNAVSLFELPPAAPCPSSLHHPIWPQINVFKLGQDGLLCLVTKRVLTNVNPNQGENPKD